MAPMPYDHISWLGRIEPTRTSWVLLIVVLVGRWWRELPRRAADPGPAPPSTRPTPGSTSRIEVGHGERTPGSGAWRLRASGTVTSSFLRGLR